jgi:hypothetical protein
LPGTTAVCGGKIDLRIDNRQISRVVQYTLISRVASENIDPEVDIRLQLRRLWEGLVSAYGAAEKDE